MPDLFYGDPVPLSANMAEFSVPDWVQGKLVENGIPHTPQTVDPIVDASLEILHEKYKCKVSR